MPVFIIDTNTLISAALFPNSIPAKAFNKAKEGILIASIATLLEIKEVIQRPKFEKYITLKKRLDFLDEYNNTAVIYNPDCIVTACRDERDNKFLELALCATANCIISGDDDLLVLHPFQNISILNPADFLLHHFS